ncbi:reverse transcriptase domain-containing protein [Candidatus Oscillochloris fontis]|uniref:reverse transcriptase domain-containing protein n=1 Tax=Candidatus Oscillochloris fontis TaxID=2496868 RepID=UPI00101CFFF4|nr:reverse transcriptase domain-containing protein [Candidatus Oscillochloris fontis]
MRLFPAYTQTRLIDQICAVDNMTYAYRQVRSNIAAYRRARSTGPDGLSLHDFDANWPQQMANLTEELRNGTYQPIPARMVAIPKKSGGERAITIMAIRDRIAQRATLQVLEPIFDPLLHDAAYGCRPRLSVTDAIERVARYAAQGYTWVVDADIQDYFSSIDQRLLLTLVRQRVPEVAILRLIAAWLRSGNGAYVDVAPLAWEEQGVPSLLNRTLQTFRRMWDNHTEHRPPIPPTFSPTDPVEDWEAPEVSAWRSPYSPPTPYGVGQQSPLNNLWTALMLAQPALNGVRRAWPSIQRIGGRRIALAGAVAAGAIAAYEVATNWPREEPRGTAQGGPLSPLLANIYLHPFDIALTSQGLRLVRYMDDFVVMCASQSEAERTLRLIERQLTILNLRLNHEKSSIRNYNDGLDFLGQSLIPRRRGPTIERGLQTFSEAEVIIRTTMKRVRTQKQSSHRRRTNRKPAKGR